MSAPAPVGAAPVPQHALAAAAPCAQCAASIANCETYSTADCTKCDACTATYTPVNQGTQCVSRAGRTAGRHPLLCYRHGTRALRGSRAASGSSVPTKGSAPASLLSGISSMLWPTALLLS